MYTEENTVKRFPLRNILLKVMVVIVFLLLVIFIVSKISTPTVKTASTKTYDKVFNKNLNLMEKAALTYYTKDNLPLNVGDVSELTLREMINKELLDSFTDANKKACDVNASSIKLTKNDNNYTLKVTLKCANKKDYKLSELGEYKYCKNTLCKKDSSKEEKEQDKNTDSKVTDKVPITKEETNTSSSQNNSTTKNNTQISKPSTSTKPASKSYEYKKVTPKVLSKWSSWSPWAYNNDGYQEIKCNSTDSTCLKEIQLYSRTEYIGTQNGEKLYGKVTYYSYRTRSVVSEEQIDIKWSSYNDTNLLNNGYSYTGKEK